MVDILKDFLEAEINTKELYDEMVYFINSYEVRRGEFEGNEYVILKMDRENFIIYPEHEDRKGNLDISFSMAVYKTDLLRQINKAARYKGMA